MEPPLPSTDRRGHAHGRTGRPAGAHVPFAERKRRERRAARERVAARSISALSAAQRANDPLARGRIRLGGRLLRALGALVGSTAVHAAVVGLGVLLAGWQLGRREATRQQIDIQVREHVPPPPPPPPPEPTPPEPEPVVKKPVRPPPVAKAEPPPEPKTTPPPRVVGLSLESTTEGGGDGPSFAVGNTRQGETAERAVDPNAVPKEAPPPEVAPGPNQTASRIPTAGVVYEKPKRKQPSTPPFPETLKAQGIEGDVTVMVTLDATGKVTSVKVIKEAVYPEFNEAARAHALTEEYEPATRDGVPIPYSLSFTYRFRLEEQ